MYPSRVEKLFKSSNCDAYLITSPENLYYFSGFTGGEGALFLTRSEMLLFTDSRYTVQAKLEAPDFLVFDVAEKPLMKFLKDKKEPIGFEDGFCTFREFLNLKKNAPSVTFVPATEEIQKVRMIKTDTEIALIEKAASIADDAFLYILPRIKPEKTEKEIALDLEFFMRKNGAEGTSFETISASGVRSSMPHGIATDKKIEIGDFLTLDFGCKFRGYCSDMTRTVVLGKASERQKEIYETVLKAQRAALENIRAGMKTKEIDAVARNMIENAGFKGCFGHGLGHSLGLEVHEKPSLSPKSEDILQENMLMTIEPGIYIDGFGGVRIEDLVVVTKDGYKNLVHSPKELIEL